MESHREVKEKTGSEMQNLDLGPPLLSFMSSYLLLVRIALRGILVKRGHKPLQ